MERYDAMEQSFEEVYVLGNMMLFTDIRIDRESIPKGLYMYEVRHSDADWTEPCQIGRGIRVNFYGTLISNCPILLDSGSLRDLSHEDWSFEGSESTVEEYYERYPPIRSKAKMR